MPEPLEQCLAILCPRFAALLELDDSTAHFPIGGGQNTVDRSSRAATRIFQQDGNAGEKNAETRTSFTAPFARAEDTIVQQIEERIAASVGFPVANLEPLLVVRYGLGQYFKAHVDFFAANDPAAAGYFREGGQRLFSVVLFLNLLDEDEPGGATNFPQIGLRVVPEPGAALLWRNQNFQGQDDPRTTHLGEIVGFSEKWIITAWVRERAFIGV